MLILRKSIVTVDILYYRPDYNSILQEFIWQTEDTMPNYPRINKFLNYWKNDINAVINEILISEGNSNTWRRCNWYYTN